MRFKYKICFNKLASELFAISISEKVQLYRANIEDLDSRRDPTHPAHHFPAGKMSADLTSHITPLDDLQRDNFAFQ